MKRRLVVKLGTLALAGCVSHSLHEEKPYFPQQEQNFDLPIPPTTQSNLRERLQAEGFALGTKIFLRIFKEENVLEAWLLRADGRYHLYRKFPICTYSGELGPKLRQGDKQSPEGFYAVSAKQMNPNSKYHLSFNLGFPNAYDKAHGYTGSYLMVHGDCVSIGCYAMTDAQIEIIYALVSAAHQRGQFAVPVHIFPFHLTQENLMRYVHHRWFEFWQMLQAGYEFFERERIPPQVSVRAGKYQISSPLALLNGEID